MSTVYIIDDDPQIANMFGKFLNYIGYNNKIYTHVKKYFNDNSICTNNSIMVLDLNMPGMDGIEVMRKMAKTDRSLPLILISGCDSGVPHSVELLAKAHLIEIIATIRKLFQFKYFKKILQKYFKFGKKTTASLDINKIVITRNELNEILFNSQLELYYHQQIDIKSKLLIAVEALFRWNHPAHGLIHSNLLISFTENHRLIREITKRVINLALDQFIIWRSMSLSIDDFGTDYSTLSQLYRVPLTELKIDKSFVLNMLNEDKEALDLLDEVDCDTAQGYYLAKPICAEDIPQWQPPSKQFNAIYNLKQLP